MPKPLVVPSPRSPSAAVPATFTCSRSPGRLGAVWFHLTGELDLSCAHVVAGQLREAQASSYLVVINLRELEFIDCAGLGLLATADACARRMKKCLVLIRGSGQVDGMLELTGLLEELEVVDVRASTLGSPRAGRRGGSSSVRHGCLSV